MNILRSIKYHRQLSAPRRMVDSETLGKRFVSSDVNFSESEVIERVFGRQFWINLKIVKTLLFTKQMYIFLATVTSMKA